MCGHICSLPSSAPCHCNKRNTALNTAMEGTLLFYENTDDCTEPATTDVRDLQVVVVELLIMLTKA